MAACSGRSPDVEGRSVCSKACIISDDEMALLLKQQVNPSWWEKETRICYVLMNKMFQASYDFEGSIESIILTTLNCLDPKLKLPSKISSNLKKKVTRFLFRNRVQNCRNIDDFYVEDKIEIGPECTKHSVSIPVIRTLSETGSKPNGFPGITLTNGVILELNKLRMEQGKTWKDFQDWILGLSISKADFDQKSL